MFWHQYPVLQCEYFLQMSLLTCTEHCKAVLDSIWWRHRLGEKTRLSTMQATKSRGGDCSYDFALVKLCLQVLQHQWNNALKQLKKEVAEALQKNSKVLGSNMSIANFSISWTVYVDAARLWLMETSLQAKTSVNRLWLCSKSFFWAILRHFMIMCLEYGWSWHANTHIMLYHEIHRDMSSFVLLYWLYYWVHSSPGWCLGFGTPEHLLRLSLQKHKVWAADLTQSVHGWGSLQERARREAEVRRR